MVVYYYRFVPFVATESGTPESPLQSHPRFIEVAANIGGLADFIVITSNFLHVFRAGSRRSRGTGWLPTAIFPGAVSWLRRVGCVNSVLPANRLVVKPPCFWTDLQPR